MGRQTTNSSTTPAAQAQTNKENRAATRTVSAQGRSKKHSAAEHAAALEQIAQLLGRSTNLDPKDCNSL